MCKYVRVPLRKSRACEHEGDVSPRETPPSAGAGKSFHAGRLSAHGDPRWGCGGFVCVWRGFLLGFPAGATAGKDTEGPEQRPPRRGWLNARLRGGGRPPGSAGSVTAPSPTRVGSQKKITPGCAKLEWTGIVWGSDTETIRLSCSAWVGEGGRAVDLVLPLPHVAFRGEKY